MMNHPRKMSVALHIPRQNVSSAWPQLRKMTQFLLRRLHDSEQVQTSRLSKVKNSSAEVINNLAPGLLVTIWCHVILSSIGAYILENNSLTADFKKPRVRAFRYKILMRINRLPHFFVLCKSVKNSEYLWFLKIFLDNNLHKHLVFAWGCTQGFLLARNSNTCICFPSPALLCMCVVVQYTHLLAIVGEMLPAISQTIWETSSHFSKSTFTPNFFLPLWKKCVLCGRL